MSASLWRRFWREPLSRFFAAGAGLFVLYALVGDPAPSDDRRIVIDRYEVEALAALWQAQWRRPPTRDELTRLVVDRVREEVLYREALALDLDENDVLVRRRLAEKLETALNDVAATAEPSADDLRRYFETHADRYVEPAGLTLTHRFFSRDRRGDSAEAHASRALEALVAGGSATMRAAARVLTAMALWSFAAPAHGHETRLAFLEVRALGGGDFVSVLKIPVTGATAWPIEVRLPATCAPRDPDHRSRQADSLVVEQRFFCDASGAAPVMGLAGLAGGFVDVLVHVEDEHGNRLTRVASGALTEIPLSPGTAGTWDRLVLGVEHILGGVDHLLFVAGMILLVRGWRRLVATITAFTIAHSITLGMTVLDVVRVPGPPVEAFIALSIVYLAFEILRRDEARAGSAKPWTMAFAFGLMHGFGFAGALLDTGLAGRDVPMTLLLFNVGIELGQIAFAAACGAVLWGAYRLLGTPARRARLDHAAAYGLGAVASLWVIERVAGFWG